MLRRLLALTGATSLALTGTVMSAPAMAADFVPAKRYLFVRVDTGDSGKQETDAEMTAAAKGAKHYWDGVPNAPKFTVTVIPGTYHLEGNYPSCAFDLGRKALGNLAQPTDGVVTFLPSGYACFGGGTAHADVFGYDVEARGGWSPWYVIAHEIGHNFGLDHDRQVPSPWTPAWAVEYMNPFSIMASGQGPPSAWQMAKLTWLDMSAFAVNRRRRLFPITDANPAHTRGLDWRDGHYEWTLEYRKGDGVAIYRDGRIIERASSVYTLKLGQLFYTSRHQAVRVKSTGIYAWTERVTLP